MKIENIHGLSSMEDIDDVFANNMGVSVNLENDQNYVVVVFPPKNLLKLMENEKSNFLSPEDPIGIVKKMTKKVVEEAIQAYAQNAAYHLKFYSSELNTKTLDVLNNRFIARSKLLDDFLKKNELIDDIENYNLIDLNINNL